MQKERRHQWKQPFNSNPEGSQVSGDNPAEGKIWFVDKIFTYTIHAPYMEPKASKLTIRNDESNLAKLEKIHIVKC